MHFLGASRSSTEISTGDSGSGVACVDLRVCYDRRALARTTRHDLGRFLAVALTSTTTWESLVQLWDAVLDGGDCCGLPALYSFAGASMD